MVLFGDRTGLLATHREMALDLWVVHSQRLGVQFEGFEHCSCFADLDLAGLGAEGASEAGVRLWMPQVVSKGQVDEVEARRGQLHQQTCFSLCLRQGNVAPTISCQCISGQQALSR